MSPAPQYIRMMQAPKVWATAAKRMGPSLNTRTREAKVNWLVSAQPTPIDHQALTWRGPSPIHHLVARDPVALPSAITAHDTEPPAPLEAGPSTVFTIACVSTLLTVVGAVYLRRVLRGAQRMSMLTRDQIQHDIGGERNNLFDSKEWLPARLTVGSIEAARKLSAYVSDHDRTHTIFTLLWAAKLISRNKFDSWVRMKHVVQSSELIYDMDIDSEAQTISARSGDNQRFRPWPKDEETTISDEIIKDIMELQATKTPDFLEAIRHSIMGQHGVWWTYAHYRLEGFTVDQMRSRAHHGINEYRIRLQNTHTLLKQLERSPLFKKWRAKINCRHQRMSMTYNVLQTWKGLSPVERKGILNTSKREHCGYPRDIPELWIRDRFDEMISEERQLAAFFSVEDNPNRCIHHMQSMNE